MKHRRQLRRAAPVNFSSVRRGVVSIIAGLTLTVMLGAIGLAVDGGRLYLTKTELQNAADGCALAAAGDLPGSPSIATAAFLRADAAGRLVATQNRVGFQGAAVANADVTVEFSSTLGSGWLPVGSSPAANSRYVRCTVQKTGIQPYFMQILGFGNQAVGAMATATLTPAQTNCAVPMGLCILPGGNAANGWNYVSGNWYGIDFQQAGGGNNANYTGNFRWIDFYPSATAPGCSGGGASELACIMQGTGECSLPPPLAPTFSCPNGSNPPAGCVGAQGSINALTKAFNSRFGIYQNGSGNPQLSTAPPDLSGYAYQTGATGNWPAGSNAWNGPANGSILNFRAQRAAHQSTINEPGMSPVFFSNPENATSVANHTAYGADRRLVIVPIINCTSFTGGGQYAPVVAYACVLLLDPLRFVSNNSISKFEYIGPANVLGSPCATTGIAGVSTSPGPLVPALVQ